MNIWQHCLLSQRKFGGVPTDYLPVHSFIDSGKMFTYHFRHRLLLHHLYGVQLAIDKFGDVVCNNEGIEILTRDIAVAHCKEDLSGRIPTLYDWLADDDDVMGPHFELPSFENDVLESFVLQPFLRSGLRSSLLITLSDFGVSLAQQFLGFQHAKELRSHLSARSRVEKYLSAVSFGATWMSTPNQSDLRWLHDNEIERKHDVH